MAKRTGESKDSPGSIQSAIDIQTDQQKNRSTTGDLQLSNSKIRGCGVAGLSESKGEKLSSLLAHREGASMFQETLSRPKSIVQ